MIKKTIVSILTVAIAIAGFVIYENRPGKLQVDPYVSNEQSATDNLNAIRQKIRPTCTLESKNFRCEYVSQGMEFNPDNPPPKVCGCRPAFCPNGQFVIVGSAEGHWPDGSQKGTFTCSSEEIP